MDDFEKFLETLSLDRTGLVNQIMSLSSIIHIILAALFGFLILLLYIKTNKQKNIDDTLIPTIPLLVILMTVLMRMEGGKAIIFFGIFGVLSIVRFRANISQQKDVAYILFAIITGVLIGVSNFLLVLITFVVISFVILIIHYIFYKKNDFSESVVFSAPKKISELKEEIEKLFNEDKVRFKLIDIQNEYSYSKKILNYEYKTTLLYKVYFDSMTNYILKYDKISDYCKTNSIEIAMRKDIVSES